MSRTRALSVAIAAALAFSAPASGDNAPVTVQIDVQAGRRAIDPNIYGTAFASSAALRDLNCPLNRQGGNAATRYNWRANASNRGADWYFQSIAETSAVEGEMGDSFIAASRSAAAQPMLTIPTIGSVARDRVKRCSFSIQKYGAQQGNDWQWFPDAGNGVRTNGTFVTGNDPADANRTVDSLFQQDWVRHLVGQWGLASNGGLRYYILDNEPSIWHSTHRDVFPTGATMEQVRDRLLDYGARIKAVDPGAILLGPEEWGWSGYLFSGYDQQWGSLNGWGNLPDRSNHGGSDYLPWLLDQLRQNQASTGKRILDIFTVHYYPQGGEFWGGTDAAMQLRRNRSTRSLWDPAYTDESWIDDRVRLVPRLREWVSTHYPGTKIGITEYNWGAEDHVNGATTQADVLGIFGREGLDLANRWTTPGASTPTYKAMKLFRNYDGKRSTFGSISVRAAAPNPDELAAYAAVHKGDALLNVILINKVLSGSTPVTVNLGSFNTSGTAQAWQLTAANRIDRLPPIAYANRTVRITVPPQSVTHLVVPQTLRRRMSRERS